MTKRRRLNPAVLGAPISVLYPINVMSLSPIAYWPLDDTSGTTAVNLVSATLNGTYTACTLGQAQAPFVAPLFDGSTSFCNIYSAGLDTAKAFFSEGSFSVWIKVAAAGVWTDGANRELFRISATSTTETLAIRKTSTNGQIAFYHTLGSTGKAVVIGSLSYTGWTHYAITASDSGDEMKAFINGAQVGTTQTSLGTQSANSLLNTNCVIGAYQNNATNPWSGWIAHVALWNRPLTPTEVSNLYAWGL